MNFQELHEYVKENGVPTGPQLRSKSMKWFVESLISETQFIDTVFPDKKITHKIRLQCVESGVADIPLCVVCNENYSSGITEKRFSPYCSNECRKIGKTQNHKDTCMKKYGTDTVQTLPHVQEKIKQTNRERYGCDWSLSSKEVREKSKQTSIERYGYEHPQKNKEASAKRKETMLNRYGVDNPSNVNEFKDKREQTLLSHYGVKNATQSEEVRDKVRQTNIERYGVASVLESEDIKERIKNTNIEKYGSEYPMQNEGVAQKAKNTLTERYGHDNPMKIESIRQRAIKTTSDRLGYDVTSNRQVQYSEETYNILHDRDKLIDLYSDGNVQQLADSLNVCYKTAFEALKAHGIETNKLHQQSSAEKEITEHIESYGFTVVQNDRSRFGFEVDIYVPEKKLAIEFNGIYWHSSLFKDKDFHQKKAIEVWNQGETLFHIWEDQWIENKELILSKIKSMLGVVDRIYARNCDVVYPDVSQVKKFMNSYHIQGFKGATKHIGLQCENEIVAVLSILDKGNGVWAIERFATRYSVVGGFSKALSEFSKSNDWKSILTYASLDYGHGNMYEKCGFSFDGITDPGLWYTTGKQMRIQRQSLMKHKLPYIFDDYDSNMAVNEFLAMKKIFPIYDAGSVRYVLNSL